MNGIAVSESLAQIVGPDGPVEVPARALFVVAHPDDIDFGSAGTAAVLTEAGSHVAYCLVTSGDAGCDDMSVSTEDLRDMREAEQTAAAKEVGVSTLHWLRVPDGTVEFNLDLRKRISRVIRMEKPDVVISQSPEPNWDRIYGSHPDHIATAQATMAAVYPDSRNPRAFPELLEEGHEPHTVSFVWMGSQHRTLFVDITDVFDRKVAALRAHTSQTSEMGERLPELLTEWSSATAKAGGLPEGRLAEGFRLVTTS